MFTPLEPQPNFPLLEEEMLTFWQENAIFEKSLNKRQNAKKWNFVDGPPFITGLPHYGTLLSSIPKDIFPRFWTMKGYYVRRVWGWDVHGLPAENKVEALLGVKRKKDIEEKIGVKKFIEECKKYVSQVSGEWEWYVNHIARWVDFKNAYKTNDLTYMESVMWVFKQMYEKSLIYKGLRISLYCPHCSTPISNFEVAMDSDNYKTIEESATTYKYKVKGQKNTFLLAWSTTPWNKIATPALAVNPKLTYVKVQEGDEKYILAKSTLKILTSKKPAILETFKGAKLLGLEFEPHYDFYSIDPGKKAFIVIGGDFVTADEGTGIVTIAAYGEEDLAVMKKENIQIVLHVDDEGMILPHVPQFGGLYYLKANKAVNEDLEKRGLIYKDEKHTHSVPTCWRCHTRLYYAPQDAWYVNIQSLKNELKKTNEQVNWFPAHFKYGRFLKSLEAAPDWCISRSRYWGSPVPVWECECGERFVPGSIADLEKASGQKVTDLHKPDIDEVQVTCKNCGKKVKRVSEVLDSWIEAGSAPYAERYYPFAHDAKLEEFFPPDFIVEYTGQIRAWFYVLHVLAGAIFSSNAFKNVVVTGVILGSDGRKMSKNYGNYPDPKMMLEKYGGDALRLYLMGSPVMKGEDILISEEEYRNQLKTLLIPLWNVYKFFTTYANADSWKIANQVDSTNVLDVWMISKINSLVKDVTSELEKYDTVDVVTQLTGFIDDMSKWYIRRSRQRVGPQAESETDKNMFYSTTFQVLKTYLALLAPIAPFISDYLYKNLTEEESVHLTSWPKISEKLIDSKLEVMMQKARKAVEEGHAQRKEEKVKVRVPLRTLNWKSEQTYDLINSQIWTIVLDELNAKNIVINDFRYPKNEVRVTDEQLQHEGELRDLVRQIQEERKKLGYTIEQKISLTVPAKFSPDIDFIKKRVLASKVALGNNLIIK